MSGPRQRSSVRATGSPLRSKSSSIKNGKTVWSVGEDDAPPDLRHGFERPEMYSKKLAGSVKHYERHVFLGWTEPAAWPANLEAGASLPKALSDAMKAKKKSLHMETKLTVFEAKDGGEFGLGDALVFPDMICVRQLTRHDAETFVDEILVASQVKFLERYALPLSGSHVFVCCHGTRDPRCGACGPILVKHFKEEVASRGMESDVWVHPCSHVGGHQYAGNVIIFSRQHGAVTGDWYGYVTPNDVGTLLDSHIGRGEVVEHLWRGRMGMTEAEQEEAQLSRARQPPLGCGESGACEQCPCRQGMSSSLTESSSPEHAADSSSPVEPIESCCRMAPNRPRKPCVILKPPRPVASTPLEPAGLPEPENKPASSQWTARVADRLRTCSLPNWLEKWGDDRIVATTAVVALSASVALTVAWHASRAD